MSVRLSGSSVSVFESVSGVLTPEHIQPTDLEPVLLLTLVAYTPILLRKFVANPESSREIKAALADVIINSAAIQEVSRFRTCPACSFVMCSSTSPEVISSTGDSFAALSVFSSPVCELKALRV
jgi:hypothetical protein